MEDLDKKLTGSFFIEMLTFCNYYMRNEPVNELNSLTENGMLNLISINSQQMQKQKSTSFLYSLYYHWTSNSVIVNGTSANVLTNFKEDFRYFST